MALVSAPLPPAPCRGKEDPSWVASSGSDHGVVTSSAWGCWDTLSTTGTMETPQQLPAIHFARLQEVRAPLTVSTEPVLTGSTLCWAAFLWAPIGSQAGAFRSRGRRGGSRWHLLHGALPWARAGLRTATPWVEGPRWLSWSGLRLFMALEPPRLTSLRATGALP